MALLDDIRKAVRVSPIPIADSHGREPGDDGWTPTYTSDFDSELLDLAYSALAELTRVGVHPDHLSYDEVGSADGWPLSSVKQAVLLYAKAYFGYDNDEADRFLACFDMAERNLLNSSANVAASRISMADCSIGAIPDQPYTGLTVRPVPSVSYDGRGLNVGEDFTVSYVGNVGPGTATAYVEGTGEFGGVVKAKFEIVGE